MADRTGASAVVGFGAALGVCCGLPWLLSIGAIGAIAGWGFQNWLIAMISVAVLLAGVLRWRRRTSTYRQHDAPVDTATVTRNR